ncbi:MAG: hypothetical protein Q4C53_03685 [Clostridia bacterium]|nr:hypothetical protein [Clostridia bacterium]
MIEAIVYSSYAGHTQMFAKLLGKETGLKVLSLDEAKALKEGTEIVYLGWLVGGNVANYEKAVKRFRIVAVGAVGMSAPGKQEPDIRKSNKLPDEVPVFELQGGYEPDKVHGIYKLMMKMMGGLIGKQLRAKPDRTPEEDEMLEMMKSGKNCVTGEQLAPLVNFIREA